MLGAAKGLMGAQKATSGARSSLLAEKASGRLAVKANPVGGYVADALGPKPQTFAGYRPKAPLKSV